MPILCALVGATGVGKTDLSLSLAKEFHAEIISMDSRQIYHGFRIGTAQPSQKDRAAVPHHLVDFLPPTENYSVGEFVRNVKELIQQNPNVPYILVGGTGMYLQALTEGLAEIPKIQESVRAECEDFLKTKGRDALIDKVRKVDPISAQEILPQDTQRLLRAAEVFCQTGRRFSDLRKERVGGIGKLCTFWLDRDRITLYKMIDERVKRMVSEGWKEEVVSLYETIPQSAPAWQSLGYREWIRCIEGKMSESELVEMVRQTTRRYAKRQITWFRHQVSAVSVDLGRENSENLAKISSVLRGIP